MNAMTKRVLLPFLIVVLFTIPFVAYSGESREGNEICMRYGFKNPNCACGQCCQKKCSKAQLGIKGCDCSVSPPTGRVTAQCVTSINCLGTGSTDQQGKEQGIGDAKGMGEALKGIMDMLKQAMKGGGGGGGGQPPPPPETGKEGCTQYYQVTAPSADPCASYVPPTSSSLLTDTGVSGSDALLDALNAGGGELLNVSDTLIGSLGGLPEETTKTKTDTSPPSTASSPIGENLSGQQVNLQSGTRGDIVVTEGGATIIAQARDAGANTEVAGFYGSDAYGGQPQGIIAGMCKNRPWANSVVSFVIPPVFFDGLCAWRGYQVGAPAPPSPPVVEQTTPKTPPAPALTPQATTPTVPPQVDIWAVPEKVPLGTRTSIFWNTKGVESCSITSPEGSFNENTLSGGAATVPLSGVTTFTISCLTAGGTPVTDFVTVNLSI